MLFIEIHSIPIRPTRDCTHAASDFSGVMARAMCNGCILLHLSSPPSSCEELTYIALMLRERIDLDPKRRFRLVGVGLGNFRESGDAVAQPALFG